MTKISDGIEHIKRNYTKATLAHAESNLGDSPGIAPPAFKLHVQQNAFKASERSMIGQGSFQLKESGQESKNESKANSGASYVQNFQSKFNTDLSDVKVKPNSEEANNMGTKAFAKGNQIHFANGVYQPNSEQGQKVLGHELVHVLQQRKGLVNSEGIANGHHANDNPGLEHEANHQAQVASKNGDVNSTLKGTKTGNIAQPVAQGFLGGILNNVKKVVGKVSKPVKKVAGSVAGGIFKAVNFVSGGLKRSVGAGISIISKMAGLGGIAGKVKKIINSVSKKTKSGFGALKGGLKGMMGLGKRGLGALAGAFKGGLGLGKKGFGALKGGLKGMMGFGKKGLGKLFGAFKGGLKWGGKRISGIIKKIYGGISGGLDKGLSIAKKMAKAGGGLVSKIFESGKSKLSGLLKKGMSAAGALAHIVKDKLKQGAGAIFKPVGRIKSDPIGALKTIVEKAVSGGSNILGFVKGVGKNVIGKAKHVLSYIKKRGSGFWKGLKEVGGGIFGVLKTIGSGLSGGILQMAKGNFLSGLKMMGMGAVNGILGTIDVILDSTLGMLDFTFGSAGEGQEISGKQIPKRHIMDEYCAHSIAYKDASALAAGTAMSAEEQEVLKKGGYDPDNMHVRTGPHGFQAVLIMPLEPDSGLKPMLAMRGTADFHGVMTDADPQQVGQHQFESNKKTIETMIKMAGGKVDITGHSLGGAMAQITAAHYTSAIGRVTTFQSPGISKETVKLFSENLKKNKGKGPEVAHHTVKNDLVSKAGQENLPGTTFEHNLGEINPLEAHTSWTSGTAGRRADRADYGMTDEFFNNQIGKEIYDESTITKFKSNPHVFKRMLAESVRSLVGTIRDGGFGLFNLGKTGVSKAWNFMQKIQSGIKNASGAAKQLVMKFIKASATKKKQLLSLMTKIMRRMGGTAKSIIANLR